MPTLKQLIRNRATVEIAAADGDEPLRIEYQPAAITPRLMARMEQVDDLSRSEQLTVMTDYLVAVIVNWNLNRADGTVIPLTREALLDEVDFEAQSLIFSAIMEDNHMGEANSASASTLSASRSSRTAKRATSRQ